jgi:hypothetical protein
MGKKGKRSVKFTIDVNEEGQKPGISRSKTPSPPRRRSSYSPKQANAVAKRIESEVRSPLKLQYRVTNEVQVDRLLQYRRMTQFISRVYRLTDPALQVLKRRLLIK